MLYDDGSEVMLGDLISVPVPSGMETGRVVMLGDSYAHLEIDHDFLMWVTKERVLETSSVVIEWLGDNPFAHNDPKYAPVGRYMFTPIDKFVTRVD